MSILLGILTTIQVLSAIALILIIAVQTTKSEQSGGGMGWGTIGGQASTSVHKFGLESQLTRVTTWIAVSFFVLSFLGSYVEAYLRNHPSL
ncbi:MAG TPA: preprotein translocase subunit SecG [Armatimonadota bacterium]